MSPLNIHPEEAAVQPKKKKNKTLKVMLGIAALVAVPVVGTTLAASITLNSGGAVQFGQGSVQATACDDAIVVTPTSTFDNDATFASTSFKLGTIAITGIANACTGKTFKVRVFGASSDTPLTVATGGATTTALIGTVTLAATPSVTVEASATYTAAVTYSSDASSLTFTLAATPVVAATDVYRITVETS